MTSYRMLLNGDLGITLQGNSQGALSVSGTAAQTAEFTADGYYDMWSDVDVWIKIAATANDVTTSTGYLIVANTVVPNFMINRNERIGAIAGGAGTLRYHKVS